MTLIVRPGYGGAAVSDPDAQAYLQAVEVADNQALEQGVQQAVNQFVIGCKVDGIWTAIKASCILAGARTLTGALVPLVGAEPTNNGFIGIGTDYNRKTGLVGNGSTKYLNSNRNNNADPQNNQHLSVYATTAATAVTTTGQYPCYIGAGGAGSGTTAFQRDAAAGTPQLYVRSRTSTADFLGGGSDVGLIATNRSDAASFVFRRSSVLTSYTRSSQTPFNGNIFVYANTTNGTTPSSNEFANARLAFYSIGESLDLALLDARVSALITAFGVAIP
jgi:hypothetical protein